MQPCLPCLPWQLNFSPFVVPSSALIANSLCCLHCSRSHTDIVCCRSLTLGLLGWQRMWAWTRSVLRKRHQSLKPVPPTLLAVSHPRHQRHSHQGFNTHQLSLPQVTGSLLIAEPHCLCCVPMRVFPSVSFRPPEMPLYNDGDYSFPADVWAAGCVFGELLGALR